MYNYMNYILIFRKVEEVYVYQSILALLEHI